MKKKINYLLFLFIFIVYNNLYATKIEILAKINNRIITNIDLEYRWEEEKYLHGMVNNTTASIVLCFVLILLSICKIIK